MKVWHCSLLIAAFCFGCSSSSDKTNTITPTDTPDAEVDSNVNPQEDSGNPDPDAGPDVSEDGSAPDFDADVEGFPYDASQFTDPVQTGTPTPLGDPVVTTIGPAGGTVETRDKRLKITFPPGAVETDTDISVTVVTNDFPTGVGVAYDIQPSGVTFAQPVTLTFSPEPGDMLNGTMASLNVAWQDPEGYWKPADSLVRDANANTLTATVSHFCAFMMLRGYMLIPMQAEVANATKRKLDIWGCYPTNVENRFGCTYLTSDLDTGNAQLDNAAVNGIIGGSSNIGYVPYNLKQKSELPYYAPQHTPTPPWVAVSVDIAGPLADGWETPISQITILETTDLGGYFRFRFKPDPISQAYAAQLPQPFMVLGRNVVLKQVDDGAMEANYQMTGLVSISPTRFVLGDAANSIVCEVTEAEKEMNPTNLKIVKPTQADPYKAFLRWYTASDWVYNCPTPGGPVQIQFQITFGTGTGTGCMTPDDNPINTSYNPNNPYIPGNDETSNCMNDGTTVANYFFRKY